MQTYRCNIDDMGIVLDESIINPYSQGVKDALYKGIKKTTRNLADRTRGKMAGAERFKAPVDAGWESKGWPNHRAKKHGGMHGVFVNHITYRMRKSADGNAEGTWYVKGDEYRLTHLLAKGHRLRGMYHGTLERTHDNPWLANAVSQAGKDLLPNVQKEIRKI